MNMVITTEEVQKNMEEYRRTHVEENIVEPVVDEIMHTLPGNRVVWHHEEPSPVAKRTRTILAVRGAHVDGVYHETVYIKA